jgi:hypothetical protein
MDVDMGMGMGIVIGIGVDVDVDVYIVACFITGSNTTCLNVIFTITEFRNNYINCCAL